MSSNAYIKLVPSSPKVSVTTSELKELFSFYQEITKKTGTQVDWKYESAAFPYQLKETEDGKDSWFYLHSTEDRYGNILLGVDQETARTESGEEYQQTYVQITLPESSTYGDKGKANEFCKFLAKKLQAELHLFNGRIMYFNPRR